MNFIFHLSDLHIGSWNKSASRYDEYLRVFKSAHEILKNYSPETIMVVITGDVFHFKTRYSGEDVALFKELLLLIKDYKVVIIAGNHDTTVKNFEEIDLISPLLDMPNIIFKKETSLFEVSAVKFHHVSMAEASVQIADDAGDRILLYHGFANGAKFGSHTVADSIISAEVINKYKLTLLGDIHEHQFITKTAAYSGSLIQQNLGESTNKGIIIWNINNRNGQFMRISNDCELLRFDLRGKTANECQEIIASQAIPKTILKLSIITDTDQPQDVIADIETKFGKINTINRVSNQAIIDPNKDILETLGTMLDSRGVSPESRDHILLSHQQTLSIQERRRWSVVSLEWSNMLKYGNKVNKIDFTKFEGALSGVIGNNCLGKSSIIDILVYALFGSLMRDTKDTFIHFGASKSSVKVVIKVNDEVYFIRRIDNRNARKTNTLEFFKHCGDELVDLANGSSGVVETNQRICQIIGTKEQFFATSLYTNVETDILKTDGIKRLSLLSTLFGMIDPTNTLKQINQEKKDTDTQIRNLIKPKDPNSASKIGGLKDKLNAISQQYDNVVAKRDSLKNNLNELQLKYANIRDKDIIMNEITSKQEKIDNLKKNLLIIQDKIEIDVSFASEVVLTNAEKELAQSDEADLSTINEKILELKRTQSTFAKTKPTTKYTKTSLSDIDKEIAAVKADSRNNIIYKDSCECCQQNKAIIHLVVGEASLSKLKNLEEKRQIAEREIAQYNDQLRSYIEFTKIESSIAQLEKQIERASLITNAITKSSAAYRYEQYLLSLNVRECEMNISRLSSEIICLHDEYKKAAEVDGKLIKALNDKIIIAERIMNDAAKQIGELNNIIKYTEEDAKIAAEYSAKSGVLTKKYDEQCAYYDCLKSNSLKILAISKMMRLVIDNTNSQLRDICDFILDFEVKESSLDIFIVEQNGLRKPIKAGSGFQNAIISILFRLTLTTLLSTSAEFIIMDEPLQYVDEEKINKVMEMLAMMPSIYKFVFIISHISDLKQIISIPVSIRVMKDGSSFIDEGIASTVIDEGMASSVIDEESFETNKDTSSKVEIMTKKVIKTVEDEIIKCHICDKEVKKKSYSGHLKSASHIKNVDKK